MSKKKSKGPKVDPKTALAQQRNEYIKRLANFCKEYTDNEIVGTMPKYELTTFFITRIRTIALLPEPGLPIDPERLAAIKTTIIRYMKTTRVTPLGCKGSVLLYDLCTLGVQLYALTPPGVDLKYSAVMSAFMAEYFNDHDKVSTPIHDHFERNMSWYLHIIFNNYCNGYYAFQLSFDDLYSDLEKDHTNLTIRIKHQPAVCEKFIINRHSRPAYRMGWSCLGYDFFWHDLTPQQLGIETGPQDLPIPVYIQMHAINRLFERLDCIDVYTLKIGFIASMTKCRVTPHGSTFLIDYLVMGVKVGYLSALLVDGKLVVRTFLLLTCKDTPEGNRLESYLGIRILDSRYLKLDRLSTFMTDQVNNNVELRNLFINADCRELVELYDKLEQFANKCTGNSLLGKLTDYLKTEDCELPELETIEIG